MAWPSTWAPRRSSPPCLDLATGRQVRIASRLNPQTRFGDDVLTRILMARTSPDGLEQLQRVVVEAIDEMIGELCDATGIARQQVYNVTLAGNTTMQQTLLRHRSGAVGRGALRARGPTRAGFSGRGRRPADPSPRPGLCPADHRRFRGRRHRRRHPGDGPRRLHGPDPLDRYRHQRRDRALGGRQAHGHLDRRRAGLRRRADRPGDAGQSRSDREGRGRSGVARPRDRPRSAAGAVRLRLDRRHGRTPAARHRLAPRPADDPRRTARRRAAGPRPADRTRAIGKSPSCLPTGRRAAGRQEGGVDAARPARRCSWPPGRSVPASSCS